MADRLEQLIEMECADALLDSGVSVPLKRWKLPWLKRPVEVRVTMKRPRLWGQILLAGTGNPQCASHTAIVMALRVVDLPAILEPVRMHIIFLVLFIVLVDISEHYNCSIFHGEIDEELFECAMYFENDNGTKTNPFLLHDRYTPS